MATASGFSASTAISGLHRLEQQVKVGSAVLNKSAPRAIGLAATVLILFGAVAAGCGGGGKETSEPPTTTATTSGGGGQASGAQLFSNNCQSCHGFEGAGGHVGPNLQKSSVAEDLAAVEKQVRNGKGAMPPFADVLSAKEIETVAHYVVEQIAPKDD
jgi:mono/diheme cytochrome c family protein